MTTVGGFNLNADACTGWTLRQMSNITKNMLHEIKTKLVECNSGTWKGTGDTGERKCVITDMKLLSAFYSIKNGSYRTLRFDLNKIDENEMRKNVLQLCLYLKLKDWK